MNERSYLILGGARSGKTRRALDIAEQFNQRLYIATAEALDVEMAERIAFHQQERGQGWATIEAPLDLATAIEAASAETVAVVDCLTLWLSNVMRAERDVATEIDALVAAVSVCPAILIMVSNELGLGLVPETPLGRAFRDHQGRLNQRIAAVVNRVDFVIAGVSLQLRP